MTTETEGTRQLNNQFPPRAGRVFAIAVAALTPSSLNLATILPLLEEDAKTPDRHPGGLNHYISIQADGADVYVITGPSNASVTSGNAPVVATVCTLASGVNTQVAGTCAKVPNGTTLRVRCSETLDAWLGFVGGGAGTMRLWRSG